MTSATLVLSVALEVGEDIYVTFVFMSFSRCPQLHVRVQYISYYHLDKVDFRL